MPTLSHSKVFSDEIIKNKLSKIIDEEYNKFYSITLENTKFEIAPLSADKPVLQEMRFSNGNDLIFCFKEECHFKELDDTIPQINIDHGSLSSIVLGDFTPGNSEKYKKFLYSYSKKLFNELNPDDKEDIDEMLVKIKEINYKRMKQLLKAIIKVSKEIELSSNK